MRLLLVEDNKELSEWLARLLRKSNYTVDCLYNAEDADHAVASGDYDLIIVDIGLPVMDGMGLVKNIRARGQDMPVLILTAIDTVTSRVRGLDLGADDYLVKPFEISELEARIRVQLRRRGGVAVSQISYGDLSLDMTTRQFTLRRQELELTKREYAVLETLMSRAGTPHSKTALIEHVFGFEDDAAPNALEVYIHRLRKKIESSDVKILTLRGMGYVLRKSNASI